MDFITILLLVVAVGAAFLIWRANQAKKEGGGATENSGSSSPGSGGELRIENVGAGGLFSLRGYGPDMEDLDVSVLARHVYDEDGYEWVELEGETGGRKIWLTIEVDDETELSVTLRKVKLNDLGLTPDDLDGLANSAGSFSFEGQTYGFDETGRANFHRNGDRGTAERLTYWDFEAGDGRSSISVERWADGSYEVHLSQTVRDSQLSVYSLRGDG